MARVGNRPDLAGVSNSHGYLRRRQEELDYWRKHAGWFDDDARMSEYNNGVSNVYQGYDDDGVSGSAAQAGGVSRGDIAVTVFKVFAVVLVVLASVYLSRMIMSKSDRESRKERKKSGKRGESLSKKRSRSRSRKGEYDLMDDEDDGKSRRSSRSKSSRRRSSRSRSRARSRSKSRRKEDEPKLPPTPTAPVLV